MKWKPVDSLPTKPSNSLRNNTSKNNSLNEKNTTNEIENKIKK